jgi:hypothetical protein
MRVFVAGATGALGRHHGRRTIGCSVEKRLAGQLLAVGE